MVCLDPKELKEIIEKGLPERIIKNAYDTAEKYHWDKSIDKLEQFLIK
jgi:hypothetical protein